MNRLIFVIYFIIGITCAGYSQLKSEDIIGNWKVVKVHYLVNNLPAEQRPMLAKLEKAFLKSKFHFSADKKFSFDFDFPEMEIKNGHWKFNQKGDSIIIQAWKDRNTDKRLLMEIWLKKEGDQILFLIEESFFSLEMKKE